MRRAIAVLFVVALGGGYATASDHPDSVNQPLRDGCNRSNLVYLGEATAALEHEGGPDAAPEWSYVVDPDHPNEIRTIRTVVGGVVASHTAGQDLFGNHRTYDLNVDIAPDAAYAGLLSTRNERETPPQIHTEWESGLVPLWAWPTKGDRARETGSWIWDCGHWQTGTRSISKSDDIPGDPLGDAGVERIGGEEAEIHPISELATWRAPQAFVPAGGAGPVPVSQLSVYISNQGGGAKSVIECATAATAPHRTALRAAGDAGCSSLQDVTGRDYVYDVQAPPRTSPHAKLRWTQVVHARHHAPRGRVTATRTGLHIVVPFKRVRASAGLQDFGASYYVWWSGSQRRAHHLVVRLRRLVIYNNLDGDSGQPGYNNQDGNFTITPQGEWNLYADVDGRWRALHTEMKAAGAGDLGDIPTKDTRKPYDLSKLAPSDAYVLDGSTFSMLFDARDCDEPGFTDCPAGHEVAFSQNPGRAAVAIPVAQLLGRTTTFTVHPARCGSSCDDNHSDKACMPTWCYAATFTVTDVGTRDPLASTIGGDGTAADTTVNGVPASAFAWWEPPPLPTAVDQDEEAAFIRRAVGAFLQRSRRAGSRP
jgi:hypothetical protein